MKRIIFLFMCFGTLSPQAITQACPLEVVSWTRTALPDQNGELLGLEIFTPCYLETYPFLQVRLKGLDSILAEATLNSFGQLQQTTDYYEIQLEDMLFSPDEMELIMVSSMRNKVQQIDLKPLLNASPLLLKEVDFFEDPSHVKITLDRPAYRLTARLLMDNDLYMDLRFNNETPLQEFLIPLPEDQLGKKRRIWIYGYDRFHGGAYLFYTGFL